MITKEIRNQIFDTASEVVQFLYASGESGTIQKSIAQKFSLDTPETYKKFALTIGDIILGFYKIEDTIPLLQQELEIDEATAAQLGSEVLEFLSPLSDPNWQPPFDEDSEIISGADESVSAVLTTSVPVVVNSVSVNEPLAIPEIRTMAGDMAHERSPDRSTFNAAADFEEPAYVSTQPIIEKKVMDVPSYSSPQYQSPKPDTPTTDERWN